MKKQVDKNKKLSSLNMQRMVYKSLYDTNPEKVKERLKNRKLELYEAALRELSDPEAKKLADRTFWWVED